MRTLYIGIPVLLVTLGAIVGCGMNNPVISQLPGADQTQIKQTLHGLRNFKLLTSLPFKATGGSASINSSLTRRANDSLTLKLYNDKEKLLVSESNSPTTFPNLPNGVKLSNGIPAAFKETSGSSELQWNDGELTISLDAQPPLTKQQLLQIADSMEK